MPTASTWPSEWPSASSPSWESLLAERAHRLTRRRPRAPTPQVPELAAPVDDTAALGSALDAAALAAVAGLDDAALL